MKMMKKTEIADTLKKCISVSEKADKGNFARGVFENLPGIVQEYLHIYIAAAIIDMVVSERCLNDILMFILITGAAEIALFIIRRLISRRRETHWFLFRNNITKMLTDKMMNMNYVHIENSDTHTQYEKAQQGANRLAELLFNINYVIYGAVLIVMGFIAIIPMAFRPAVITEGFTGFVQSPWGLISAVLAVAVSEVIRTLVFGKKENKLFSAPHFDKDMILNGRIQQFYENYVFGDYRVGKSIRLYNEQDLILEERRKAVNNCRIGWRKTILHSVKTSFGFQTMNILSRVFMYGIAIARAATGMLTPGEIVGFVMYFSRIQGGIGNISEGYSSIHINVGYCKHLLEFLNIPDEKHKGTIPIERLNNKEYEFEFKNVYFRYPNSEQYVLQDINLKWRIGEKMALVGRNGSGKSTLIKLLCRLYDPTEGEITLNGIDIREYKYKDYIDLFSVVFQDSRLFSFSIGENVAADTEYNKERVTDCVKRSGLSERLSEMEKGVETCLYKDFDEQGVEISGGEAQKLCLARAIYKGSQFIVLDEPTAALDPVSEHDIYTKFNSIAGTRTAIYISHRLSSCRFCDNITVLDGGKIAESGCHDKLLSENGVYSELWSAQAEYYKDTASELFA